MPPSKGLDIPTPIEVLSFLKKAVTERLGLNLVNNFDYEGKIENSDGTTTKTFVIDFGLQNNLSEDNYLIIEALMVERLKDRITGVQIAVETLIIKQLRTLQILKAFLNSGRATKIVETCFNPSTGQINLINLFKLMRANSFYVSIQDLADLLPFSFLSENDFSQYIIGVSQGQAYIPLTLKFTHSIDANNILNRLSNSKTLEQLRLNPDCIIKDGVLDFHRVMIQTPASRARLISMMRGLPINYFAIQQDSATIIIGDKIFQDTIFGGIISTLWILHSNRYAYGTVFDSLALHVTKPASNSPMNTLIQFSDTSKLVSTESDDFLNVLSKDLEDLDNLIKILRQNANMTQPEIENATSLIQHYIQMIISTYPQAHQIKFAANRLSNTFVRQI